MNTNANTTPMTLAGREAMNLGTGDVAIDLYEGTAWVVHNGADQMIRAGERVTLQAESAPVVISSAAWDGRIVFAVSEPMEAAQPKVSLSTRLATGMLNLLGIG